MLHVKIKCLAQTAEQIEERGERKESDVQFMLRFEESEKRRSEKKFAKRV